MKPIRTALFLAIALSFCLSFPSAQAQTTDDYTFTVHIGAFIKAESSDFNNIRPYGFLYAEKFQNNLLQVYMGEFPSEADAGTLLSQVKTNGYPDAYITRRNLQQGEKTHVIQLGIATVGEDIDWQNYIKAGPLFVLLNQQQIKITTGTFDNIQEANQRLSIVKRLGFADAFVKESNNIRLHPISTFEAGRNLVAPEVELTVEAPVLVNTNSNEEEVVEEIAEEAVVEVATETVSAPEPTPPPVELIPESYDEVLTARSPEIAKASSTLPLPTIRKGVKRTSAIELQKALKKEGTYKGSLDGFYGKGTQGAYATTMASNRHIKKYQMLAKQEDQLVAKAAPGALQVAISDLGENPQKAMVQLGQSKAAIAKAYRAYYAFTTRGAQAKVDEWMNAAIKGTFKNAKNSSPAPFDFQATYAYKDLDQLLLHLAYIHSVSSGEAAVPCWLFQRHPKETKKAFAAVGTYRIERCDQFAQWEPLQLLETIARDLDPNPSISQSMLDTYSSIRSGLFVAPEVLTKEEQKAIINWNTSLWNGLEEWTASDPVHKKMTTPLKIAYYQSMVLLEDYYMDDNFKALEAKGLALSVLQTIVAPYLESYRK